MHGHRRGLINEPIQYSGCREVYSGPAPPFTESPQTSQQSFRRARPALLESLGKRLGNAVLPKNGFAGVAPPKAKWYETRHRSCVFMFSFHLQGNGRKLQRVTRSTAPRLSLMNWLRLAAVITCCLCSLSACKKASKAHKRPVLPLKVGMETVRKGDIRVGVQISGPLQFTIDTTVSAQIPAQVVSREVKDGQLVSAGDILLRLDDSKFLQAQERARAMLQKDRAAMHYAKSLLDKNRELWKTGAISETKFDKLQDDYRGLMQSVAANEASLAQTQEDLKHTLVRAPVSGVVSKRYIENGDWVSVGGKLFEISDYRRLYLRAFVSDTTLGKLDREKINADGIECAVKVDAFPGKAFPGRLTYLSAVADSNRLFEVRVYFDNEDVMCREGMFAHSRIPVRTIRGVLKVPLDALLRRIEDNGENRVYRINDQGNADLVMIKIGITDPWHAQVLEGLEEGERIIVQGKEIVRQGQPVEPSTLVGPSGQGSSANGGMPDLEKTGAGPKAEAPRTKSDKAARRGANETPPSGQADSR